MDTQQITLVQGWPASLEEMAAFLDRNMDYDSMNAALLEEKLYLDPHADPELCFTAMHGSQIAGFIYCVRRSIRGQEQGYVKLMAVEKTLRRKKIGTLLYEKGEQLLIEKGATHIRWYDVPLNYFMPGIDPRYTEAWCFALKHGFKQTGEAINMRTDLNAMSWDTREEEARLMEKGIEVRRAESSDLDALKMLLSEEWQLWNNEVEMAMKDTPPSVHIALKEGRVLAFSVHNGNNKGTGWFGPMGTHPDLRGHGVGNILLKRCLEDMRLQGQDTAVIPWVGPVAFYCHYTRSVIERVFWRMEKQIIPATH